MRSDNAAAYSILDLQKKRWSPRAFDPAKSISPADLCSLFEAARWSPSCFNGQPWTFLIAPKEDAAAFATMLACLVEKNQAWAKHAAALAIAVAANVFDHNGKPNAHGKYDTGGAVANLTFEATAKNIYLHQMAGFDAEKTRQTYQIPTTADPVAAIALGYLGDPVSLPNDLREQEEKPKPRKTIDQFVFSEKWGQPSALIRP